MRQTILYCLAVTWGFRAVFHINIEFNNSHTWIRLNRWPLLIQINKSIQISMQTNSFHLNPFRSLLILSMCCSFIFSIIIFCYLILFLWFIGIFWICVLFSFLLHSKRKTICITFCEFGYLPISVAENVRR